MAIEPFSPQGLAKLLKSKRFSDLKLVCQGREFNVHEVHKVVVCTMSPALDAAASGQFEVSLSDTNHGS